MITCTWAVPLASLLHANVRCAKSTEKPCSTRNGPSDLALLPLCEGVGRDEGEPDWSGACVINRLGIPTRHVVQSTATRHFETGIEKTIELSLSCSADRCDMPTKGANLAEDVRGSVGRKESVPIHLQSVVDSDVRGCRDREAHVMLSEIGRYVPVGYVVDEIQRCSGNASGPFVNLNAVDFCRQRPCTTG